MIQHPTATLWSRFVSKIGTQLMREFEAHKTKQKASKKSPRPEVKEIYEKAMTILSGPIRADFPGWKAFKRNEARKFFYATERTKIIDKRSSSAAWLAFRKANAQ
jgi:hypothetical protein